MWGHQFFTSLLCKNFNVAHNSSISKGISMELTFHDKVQLLDNGHNSESFIYEVMPLFNLEILTDKH
jgi:hypothetical protein